MIKLKFISVLISVLSVILLLFTVPVYTGIVDDYLSDSIVLYVDSPVAYVNGALCRIDTGNLTPYINENNRTMIPLRFISESLGASVGWDGSTGTVTVKKDGNTLVLSINSKTVYFNGFGIRWDTAPFIIDGRTYIPLRGVSEVLGKKVFYDSGLIVIGNTESPFGLTNQHELINEAISIFKDSANTGITSPENTIVSVINALNDKDLNTYMSFLSLPEPSMNNEQSSIAYLFNNFNLCYEIIGINTESKGYESAECTVTQKVYQASGENPYESNITVVKYYLRFEDYTWKIYDYILLDYNAY